MSGKRTCANQRIFKLIRVYNIRTTNNRQKKKMAKSSISESKTETTVLAEASGEIVEGSPTSLLTPTVNDTITGDLDASDISFPRLQIVLSVSVGHFLLFVQAFPNLQ